MSSKPNIVNLFLIYSPLHYLSAELVAGQFEKGAENYLFYLKAQFKEMVDPARWTAVEFLPWPRFYPERGMLGRMRRADKNVRMVARVCSGATEIRLHTPVIDTEAVNYFINHLRSTFPGARFTVRLIPDGLLNIQRHPLGRLKEALQYCKKARRLLCPTLNYYTFRGDRIGSDTKIVDRIYVLPGLPHEYDRTKTVEISLQQAGTAGEEAPKRALVLGQPLTSNKLITAEDSSAVTLAIRNFIDACGIQDVLYKAHPRDRIGEFSHPDYRKLVISKPLESYLAATSFDLVIGVYSAALVTARLILPKSCRVVAYGSDVVKYKSDRDRENIQSTLAKLGVEMVMHRA